MTKYIKISISCNSNYKFLKIVRHNGEIKELKEYSMLNEIQEVINLILMYKKSYFLLYCIIEGLTFSLRKKIDSKFAKIPYY